MDQKFCNMMSSLRFAKAHERNKPYLAMVLVQSIYAGMALFTKASVSTGMNPFIFVVYRQAFATLSLAPIAYFFESKNAAQFSYTLLWKIFLTSFFGITLSLNLYAFAMNHTSATYAGATSNLVPTITFVIALILRMERISIKQWHGWLKVLGSVACVAGALVFAFVKGPTVNFMNWYQSQGDNNTSPINQFSSKAELIKGPLLMLLANITWSCWGIMQAPIVKEYPAKLSLTTLQCFFSLIQAAVWAVAMERKLSSWKLGWDVNLISVSYCGVVVTALTYFLQLWCIEKKGPVFTAMFTPLTFIITAIFSAFLWKETLYVGSLCGVILLAGGLYCVLWGKSRELDSKIIEQKSSETREEIALESINTHL